MADRKILIIDDDKDFVLATKVVLESRGYEVSSAGNKEEAAERVKEMLPDLIIMDVMLDKMCDGFDLSRKLKTSEKYKKIPILMITAVGKNTGFKYSAEGGDKLWLPVDDYVEKPISPAALISKVEKLLGG